MAQMPSTPARVPSRKENGRVKKISEVTVGFLPPRLLSDNVCAVQILCSPMQFRHDHFVTFYAQLIRRPPKRMEHISARAYCLVGATCRVEFGGRECTPIDHHRSPTFQILLICDGTEMLGGCIRRLTWPR